MSKAFTREGDETGFAPPSEGRAGTAGTITSRGATLARGRITDLSAKPGNEREVARLEALLTAHVADPQSGELIAFGAEVKIGAASGKSRVVMITSADEVGLVPNAISVSSPLARALIGARAGDEVEVEMGSATVTWSVISIK